MGFLTTDDAPIIWRGPMLHGALQQFFREVRWDDLDYLVVDMPPGTGDVALSLSQTVPVAGAIVVTTPQLVSLADSRRAVAMYKKLNIPTLGIVENMSYFVCRNCHHEADIFGHGGGEQMAAELRVPFLGRIPIYQPIREGSDTGVPLLISEPESPAARAFMAAAERAAAQVSIASYNRPTIPLTSSGEGHQPDDRVNIRSPSTRSPTASTCCCTRTTLSDRRGQHLVSRRIEERAARAHRLRAPVRAPDVRGIGAPRQRVLPAAAGRGRVAQRIDERRSDELLGGRADRRARAGAVDGVRSHGLSAAGADRSRSSRTSATSC